MFKEERDEPLFEWSMIGDIQRGRPNLGPTMNVATYRLMQFTLRDILVQELGADRADELFQRAGYKAGVEYYNHLLGRQADLDSLFSALQSSLRELQIGIFRRAKPSRLAA